MHCVCKRGFSRSISLLLVPLFFVVAICRTIKHRRTAASGHRMCAPICTLTSGYWNELIFFPDNFIARHSLVLHFFLSTLYVAFILRLINSWRWNGSILIPTYAHLARHTKPNRIFVMVNQHWGESLICKMMATMAFRKKTLIWPHYYQIRSIFASECLVSIFKFHFICA